MARKSRGRTTSVRAAGIAACFCLTVIASASSRAAADVVCVPNDAIDGSCTSGKGAATINAGVALAVAGDTVLVDDGSYSELVTINKNVTLLSRNGRATTTISPPTSPAAALGTILVTSNTTALQIGGVGQGFTINGLDNTSPGIESAAIYFQGSHSNAQIRDNEIVAAGDEGLLTEYGATISGFVIDGNEFSGTTFTGTPGGQGFSQQFSLANVPRQLVVMGGGLGGGNTSNITFTNNVISGTAGGINPLGGAGQCASPPCEQGNNLVTIDSNGATITGNTFMGTTTRYGVSFRARGPSTTISGNTFDSTGLTATCGQTFQQSIGVDVATVASANTFDKGVYVNDSMGTIGVSVAAAAAAAPSGTVIEVLPGTYAENVVVGASLTLSGAQAGVGACGRVASESIIAPPSGVALTLVAGAAGSVIDGFTFSGGTRGIESTSGPLDGLKLLNNRFAGFSDAGVFLNDSGIDIDADANSIDGSSKTGAGDLFHLDTDNFAGFHFTNNCVFDGTTASGFFVDGNHNVGVSVTPRAPLFDGNTIDNCQTGTNLGTRAFTGGTISNNTFSNSGYDGLQGGIQNTAITQNLFTGNGRFGLALTSFGNMGVDRGAQNDTITNNCFTANGFAQSGAGLLFSSSQAPGTISTNTANQNNFALNATGATYGGTETIDAENNFWGCVTGPNTSTCDTAANANIDVMPFLSTAAAGPAECVSCTVAADCDDGLACNGSEVCNTGTNMCESGMALDCSGAADQCNAGVCSEPGICGPDPLPDGTACSTGVTCSVQDTCSSGTCVANSPDSDGDGVCDANERAGFSLRKVLIKDRPNGPNRDSWTALGELDTTTSPGNFITAVTTLGLKVILFHDGMLPLTEINELTFPACTEHGGRIKCSDPATRSKIIFRKRSATQFYYVKIKVKKQNLDLPVLADAPISVSLRTTEAATLIDRGDNIGPTGCKARSSTFKCRDVP